MMCAQMAGSFFFNNHKHFDSYDILDIINSNLKHRINVETLQ